MAAIASILDTTLDYLGNQLTEQAILKQRTATSAKKLKAMIETNSYNNDIKRGTIQAPYASITTTASQVDYKLPIRWNRKLRSPELPAHTVPDDTDANYDPYSRYLLCTRCGYKIDAKYKQLSVKDCFRIINCPHCKWMGEGPASQLRVRGKMVPL